MLVNLKEEEKLISPLPDHWVVYCCLLIRLFQPIRAVLYVTRGPHTPWHVPRDNARSTFPETGELVGLASRQFFSYFYAFLI